MIARNAWFLVCTIVFCAILGSARAAPLDCSILLHTKIPFSYHGHSSDGDFDTQVYRSDNNFATTFTAGKDGHLLKRIRQGQFILNFVAGEYNLIHKYNYINTNNNAFFYKPKFYDKFVLVRKDGEERTLESKRYFLEYFDNDNISVGPCIVPVVHYTIQPQQTGPTENPKDDAWFSPDLGVPVRSITRVRKPDGSVKVTDTQMTTITTDFTPLKP